jgi:mRNA interferase RelE/StbE
MDSYSVRVLASSEKELHAVPKTDLKRIAAKLQALASNPRPHGCEKLSGEERYRLRQGDWRLVYSIDDDARRVVVVKVGHRREIYR